MGISLVHLVMFLTQFLIKHRNMDKLKEADELYLDDEFVEVLKSFQANVDKKRPFNIQDMHFCQNWSEKIH